MDINYNVADNSSLREPPTTNCIINKLVTAINDKIMEIFSEPTPKNLLK